ncbi:hypothetical protein BGZ63DRAFT_427229 [Mariannaea sp. PMI_226]|nr:hypothetical protein BGZ63DRAFT_427229 [Mariannaea sp. PMI_226]
MHRNAILVALVSSLTLATAMPVTAPVVASKNHNSVTEERYVYRVPKEDIKREVATEGHSIYSIPKEDVKRDASAEERYVYRNPKEDI